MATEVKAAQTLSTMNHMNEDQHLNADHAELNKFGELAHKWWDKNSEFKPLHELNPLRLGWINELTNLKGKRVLDVGCGGGILSESMYFKGAEVVGIDLGEKALNVAKLHQLESGAKVTYQYISVEQLAEQQPASFDVVTCMEMLEHVPDPSAIIVACAKLVKPGGSVFFSTINRNPKSYLFAVVGAEYLLNLLPKGTHDYAKFIKPSELSSWARQVNLDVNSIRGMSYNPITQHYSLGGDVSVNYMLHTTKSTI
jgi:2-polyprenyl-6-hydroxyphenyl methylase / 3-demethylubiquinone-9 3-methyltransferase